MKVSVLRRIRLFLSLPDPDHETKIVRKPLHTLQQIMKVSVRMFLGRPDPLVRSTDPDPAQDLSLLSSSLNFFFNFRHEGN
jgi:hypothetical protein